MKQQKKRLCLFAGFDSRGEIADYVVYYLKALSQIADIYYWGDFDASDGELAKLKPFCKAAFCQKHSKYDFGSWQELIQKVGREEIEKYDEVILANDSCYGPLFDLSNLFEEMDGRDCDFWGLSSAFNRHIHLQSYFIILKSPVIQSDVFYDFFKQVKPEANYDDVCLNYEDRFTYALNKVGFHSSSFIDYGDLANHPYKDMVAAIKNRHFPFLKVKFFLGGIRDQGGVPDWHKVITDNTDYPVELIEKDLVRRGFDLVEIDLAVREKRSETPDFYSSRPSLKRVIRKVGKIILKPILSLTDTYIRSRTAQYFYSIDRISRSCRRLQQKYDHLKSRIDPDYTVRDFHLKTNNKACDLKLDDRDATIIKRFDLELPLTSESSVLLLGNITPHNLASLELYDPQTIFLNNNWSNELKIQSESTNNLCDFKFTDESNRQIYFDFILVQPLEAESTDDLIQKFIINLKRQMIFESVLVLMVANSEKDKYEHILQSQGLCSARSEHGLVVRADPFQIYYDKIESIKGYKTLIYKIK